MQKWRKFDEQLMKHPEKSRISGRFGEALCGSEAFNGLSGKVQSLDQQTGRYDVLLISNCGSQLAKIKGLLDL